MLNGIKLYLFLVVDQETKGILTKCSSMAAATAVSKGILNSSPMLVRYPYLNHKVNQYNTDIQINYKLIGAHPISLASEVNVYEISDPNGSNKPFDLVNISVDGAWLEKRKLANFRSNKIEYLETLCERYVSRIKNFTGDELFFQYIGKELDLVNIENNQYPGSIIEWAEINSVSNNAAYYELKMLYDSMGITMVRVHAIWTKYVEKINNLYTKEEFDKLSNAKLQSVFLFGEL
jgi:hypothetical protein